MKVPLLDLTAQYRFIREEVRREIDLLCESQRFILGPKVDAFEANVARYCGAAHGVGVTSGTDALIIALMALGIGPGDAVITTPYSFFATVGAIVRVGATPVFADIDPITYNISPARVEELLRPGHPRLAGLKARAVMPVHLYGQCADMGPLMEICRAHGLKVIEDACQAIGAEYRTAGGVRRAGAIGDIGCFSFFPSKNLGGFGDGGMAVTGDPELAGRMKILRNHGAEPKYYHKLIGGNFRLDALQAVVLDVKLKYLDEWHAARRLNAARYDAAFRGSKVASPEAVYAGQGLTHHHIYNQYVVRVDDRDRVRKAVEEAGVGCEVYYPVPLHLQECFTTLGHRAGDFPESERAARETLALPIYPELTPDMLDFAAQTVLRAANA